MLRRLASGVLRLRLRWQAHSIGRFMVRLARAHGRRASVLGRMLAQHPDLEKRAAGSDLVELWRGAEARFLRNKAARPSRPMVDPRPPGDSFSFVGIPFNPGTAVASAIINRFTWLDFLLAWGFQLLLADDGPPAVSNKSEIRLRVDAAFAAVLAKEEAAASSEGKAFLRKLKSIKAAIPGAELWNALSGSDSTPRRDAFGHWRQSVEAALITLDPDHELPKLLNQTCVRNVPEDIVSGIHIVHSARRRARRILGRSFCFSVALYVVWCAAVFAALQTPGAADPPGRLASAMWLCALVPVRAIVTNLRFRLSCGSSGARRVLAPPVAPGDFVLFLRAFATDDEVVEDRTPFEFSRVTPWLLPSATSFRMRLIKSLGGLRRVIAVADPSHRDVGGDYGLIALPETRWQHNVKRAAAQASLIVVDLNDCRSPGFQWELDAVLRPEYAAKLVFVMPFGPRSFFQNTQRLLTRIGDQVILTEEASQRPPKMPRSPRGFHLLSPLDRYELACRSIRQRLPDVWLPRFSSDSLFLYLEQGRHGRLLNHALDETGDPGRDPAPAHLADLRREFAMVPNALVKMTLFHLVELLLLVSGQALLSP